jgi:hypothetical protein
VQLTTELWSAASQSTWDYSKNPSAEQISSDEQRLEIKQYVECIPGRICRESIKNGRLIFLFFEPFAK